jgi:hypothetical protein
MAEDITGRGMLEPQPPAEPFPVDCDIQFTHSFSIHVGGLPSTPNVICSLCIIRRTDRKPIADGYYTLHRDGTTESLKLKCIDGGFHALGYN